MKIRIKNKLQNPARIMRDLGYKIDRHSGKKEISFSRPVRGNKFPRFHIYYKASGKRLNLHLDQKAPIYRGASDHGAEYSGKIVEEEAERIKKYFKYESH